MVLLYVQCPSVLGFSVTGDTWKVAPTWEGRGAEQPKILSQKSQEAEWSPRGGQAGSRQYFRCAVHTETNEDSVTEGLNSALEEHQMSTGMVCLVIWIPAPYK